MGVKPKGYKVSPFERLAQGLVMLEGGVGVIMLGYVISERASDADWSPLCQGLLMMPAGLVIAVIGLILTVICFVRAIREWRTSKAPKGRFRIRIPGLVLLLAATAVGSFLLLGAPYPPSTPLPVSVGVVVSLGVVAATAVIGAFALIALTQPTRRQLSLAVCVPLLVIGTVVIAVVSQSMTPQRLVEQYQSGKGNFQGLKLPGADLHGVDLANGYGVQLEGADLSGANLAGAKLGGAYLRDANLARADLSGADLRGADLTDADLTNADLTRSVLMDAHLNLANLSGADLSGADLTDADLYRANMSGAKVTDEQLTHAWRLDSATMPDGTVHP